jgi:alkylhydroperoxidase family enzyme
MSQSPGLLRAVFEISYRVQFAEGHLSRRVKELIATWVSALNQCPY